MDDERSIRMDHIICKPGKRGLMTYLLNRPPTYEQIAFDVKEILLGTHKQEIIYEGLQTRKVLERL